MALRLPPNCLRKRLGNWPKNIFQKVVAKLLTKYRISELHKNSMDKRTKDCYDEVMICHGVDNFNCKAFENIVAVLSRYLEREKVKDNETV